MDTVRRDPARGRGAGPHPRRPGRGVRGRRLRRHPRTLEVQGGAGRAPAHLLAGPERYTPRGMGDLGQMTPDEDECVADAGPVDAADHAVGPALRLDGRRPPLRRHRAVRALHPVGAQAPARPRPPTSGSASTSESRPRSTRTSRSVDRRPNGYLEPMARTGSLKPTPAYDVEATMDAMPFLDPMVRYMNETGLRRVQLRPRGRRRAVRVRLRLRARARDGRQDHVLPADGRSRSPSRTGSRSRSCPSRTPSAWGSGAHFNMSLADVEIGAEPVPRRRRRPRPRLEQDRLLVRRRHPEARRPRSPAIATPTVNSYKRLAPRLADGMRVVGAGVGGVRRQQPLVHAAPAAQPARDREPRCRLRGQHVPRRRRSCWPPGSRASRDRLDPGEPIEDITYDWTDGPARTRVRLPRNLLEAIDAFEADPLTHEVFPGRSSCARTSR